MCEMNGGWSSWSGTANGNTPADFIPAWRYMHDIFIEEVFGYSYDIMASRTNKPIVLSEVASTELGGNKAQWISYAFAMIPSRFPRIVGLTWFSLIKECDWRVQSSPGSLQAFREAVSGIDVAQRQRGMPSLDLRANKS